jgi:hypothetical protein
MLRKPLCLLLSVVMTGFVGAAWADQPPEHSKSTGTPNVGEILGLTEIDAILRGGLPPQDSLAEQLMVFAPYIRSDDVGCKSLDLCGRFRASADGHFSFRMLYRAPDKYSLIIRDGDEGPPLAFISDRCLLLYDPVSPMIMYSSAARFEFTVSASDQEAKIFWRLWWSSKAQSQFEVDLRSLYTGYRRRDRTKNIALRLNGPNRFVLLREFPNGDMFRSTIDMSQGPAFKDLKVFVNHGKFEAVSIYRISINGEIPETEFAFPTKQRLAEGMRLRDCTNDGTLRSAVDLGLMVRAHYARLAVRNEPMRDSLKFPGLIGIDWDEVRKNDETYTESLRTAILEAKCQ